MNKNALEHFQIVAQTGNISKAAERSFASRQTLSESVRSLEAELDTALLTRSKQGVSLTKAGEILNDYIHEMQRLTNQMLERISAEKNRHTIRFGTHLMHMQEEFFDRVLLYQNDHPEIDVEFVDIEDFSAFWNELANCSIDIARTWHTSNDKEGITWKNSFDEQIFLLFGEKSPLTQKDEVDFFNDLRGTTYLCASHDTIEELSSHAQQAGINLEYVMPRTQLIQGRVLYEGDAFAAPLPSAKRMLREGVAVRPLARHPLTAGRYTVYRDDAPDYVLDFARFLEEIDREDAQKCALRV